MDNRTNHKGIEVKISDKNTEEFKEQKMTKTPEEEKELMIRLGKLKEFEQLFKPIFNEGNLNQIFQCVVEVGKFINKEKELFSEETKEFVDCINKLTTSYNLITILDRIHSIKEIEKILEEYGTFNKKNDYAYLDTEVERVKVYLNELIDAYVKILPKLAGIPDLIVKKYDDDIISVLPKKPNEKEKE